MQLSDFSSVLQLGVGLHAGTVLLQAIFEFASAPMTAKLERFAKFAALRRDKMTKRGDDPTAIEEVEGRILDAQSSLEVKKVQFFNEYKTAAKINTAVSVLLFCLLVWAAIKPAHDVYWWLQVGIVFLSAGPALLSLCILWHRWHSNTTSIRESIVSFETALLNPKSLSVNVRAE